MNQIYDDIKKIHLDIQEITADDRATETFFFAKIGFPPIKSPNSSRKSIKQNWKSRNQ
jgi:hypothetical protein